MVQLELCKVHTPYILIGNITSVQLYQCSITSLVM